MAKQRDRIRMSEDEIAACLEECQSLNVATLDKEGAPHLTTLWFAVKDGNILFETYGSSQKVVNLRRDPRIAVICEKGTTYHELRGVSVKGRGRIVDSGPELLELMTFIVKHNHRELNEDQAAALAASMAQKRVVVEVLADKVISWDHRKLAAG